jgi:hypothetical protein
MTVTHEQIEQFAAAIGEEVYLDIAKWHLYLRDAKLHTQLAEKLAPLVLDRRIDEASVAAVLSQIPIKLGGGRHELPLADLLPMQSLLNLQDVLEDFARQWK